MYRLFNKLNVYNIAGVSYFSIVSLTSYKVLSSQKYVYNRNYGESDNEKFETEFYNMKPTKDVMGAVLMPIVFPFFIGGIGMNRLMYFYKKYDM